MAKVIIVDDSAFMRGSLKSLIEHDGHHVVGMASNGLEAVELYKKIKPDLVTMDVIMKEMNGIEALKAIIEYDPNARVIMITSLIQQQIENNFQQIGACGLIKKPFANDEVIKEVQRVLGLHALRALRAAPAKARIEIKDERMA